MAVVEPYHDDDELELEVYHDEDREVIVPIDNDNDEEDPDAPLPSYHDRDSSAVLSSEAESGRVDSIEHPRGPHPRWLQSHSRSAPTLSFTSLKTWARRTGDRMTALRPRWLEDSMSSSQDSTWLDKALQLVRPRFTVGYIACSIVLLYILYCYIVWSPLFASKLPQYSGPYGVGSIDVEVPVREPRTIIEASLKTDGTSVFDLDTVLFTLYYPATRGVRSAKANRKWFPKPISLTAEGYATAAHFNNFFSRGLFTFVLWGLAGSISIPAKVDVPLLGADASEEDDGFPVVVLSHGDVSSRTDYTAYCGELASRGIVVAAMEHRDGSCPGSVVHLPTGKTKNVVLFRADQLKSEKAGEEVSNDDWRFKKLAFRDAEIQETISILQDLNDGHGDQLYDRNYRKEGKDLAQWTDRLDFSHLIVAGHSFGATGALQALKSANKTASNPTSGGIILDPGKSSGRLNTDIDVPLLIVHSDSWSKAVTIFYGRPHFDTVKAIAVDVLKRTKAAWFMTSLQTSHPSVTDAPLIEPLLLSWTTGATIPVREGLREYVRVSMEFIDYLRTGTRKGVLAVGVTHESYGNDTRSDEEKKAVPGDVTRYWQVHVAPPLGDTPESGEAR